MTVLLMLCRSAQAAWQLLPACSLLAHGGHNYPQAGLFELMYHRRRDQNSKWVEAAARQRLTAAPSVKAIAAAP